MMHGMQDALPRRASHKGEKAAELIQRLAAAYIAREANRDTLITPTRVSLSDDGKRATIYVGVFPDTKKAAALAFLARHVHDFREHLKKEARFAHLPSVHFEFDEGERERQHLDELSQGV